MTDTDEAINDEELTDEQALCTFEALHGTEGQLSPLYQSALSRVLELAESAIQSAPVNIDAIIDRDFTGGLSSADHLRNIRGESDD